jgi:DNA-binding LacI/PurR family transcriptional regulator
MKLSHQAKSRKERAAKVGRRLSTATDVAAAAGVSQSAVSRTFTEGASVSKATRDRVLAAAKALKYRPNQMARSLMTNRSFIVGVAVTHIDNQFYPKVLEVLSEALRVAGYRILLFVTHGTVDFDPALDELLKYRVDALILASTSLSSSLAEECRAFGVPVIMFNNVDPNSSIASISGENFVGGRTVAEFLVAGGHRRFAFLAGQEDSSTNQLREGGYNSFLAEAGLPRPMRANGGFQFSLAAEATRKLLGQKKMPDALFCANDHMALAAIQVARQELGIDVGRTLSVVGFDDIGAAAWPAFELTTYSQPVDAMVRSTIDLLHQIVDERKNDSPLSIVPGELIVRTSARVPKRGKWLYSKL